MKGMDLKLAICGDSFCADYGKNPYPSFIHLLQTELNADILCTGRMGISLYHAYEDLITHYKNSDIIILCVTEPSRVSNRYRVGIGRGWNDDEQDDIIEWLQTKGSIHTKDGKRRRIDNKSGKPIINPLNEYEAKGFVDAITYYNKFIRNDDFHNVVQRGILRDIEFLLKEENKKVIYFRCFDNSFCGFEPSYGVWGDTKLLNYTSAGRKEYLNHMSEENNMRMFQFIKRIIEEDDFSCREIKMWSL